MMGFHPANVGLRPFRSRVQSRHATDGWTDSGNHFIMPRPTKVGGIIGLIMKLICLNVLVAHYVEKLHRVGLCLKLYKPLL